MALREETKKRRQGVLLCGAYGMGNAGDDEVLAAILARLREIDPETPVTVMARRPAGTAVRFGVDAVHPLRVLRWLSLMGRTRLFLSGGGSLLQDVTSRRSLLFYLFTIRAAKARGCAVQLYGCGVGPLLSESSRRQTARTLNACADVITLRDRDSGALLEELGVTKPPVLLAADPALSMPAAGGCREELAGYLLRDWPGAEGLREAFAACARHVWQTRGLKPLLMYMAPEDRAAAEAVGKRLTEQGVPWEISGDPDRIGGLRLVLSVRLHGLIFALREGVPAGGVSYDPKVDAFCREAALPCLPLGDASPEAMCRLADEALEETPDALAVTLARLRTRERISGDQAARLLRDGNQI